LKVFPNPIENVGTLTFYNHKKENVYIGIYNSVGQLIAQTSQILTPGNYSCTLEGLNEGTYVVNVSTNVNKQSVVIISNLKSQSTPSIKSIIKGCPPNQVVDEKTSNVLNSIIEMQYNDGESLRFTAFLNSFNAIVELIPTSNQTISFNFSPPTADFVADQTNITEGGTISFTDQSTDNPTSWNWNFGDGNSSSEENPSHTYDNAGVYTVALTVSNDYGTDTETKIDYIIVGTPPTADFIADQTNITEGGIISFTNQSTNNPTTWDWDFGDGNSSSEENPSHTYVNVGVYTVSLTVTNDYGTNTETKTDYITVITADGPGEPISDIDGNTYQTVWIGGQNWMTENLRTTTYSDGTAIDLITDNATWGSNNTTGAYCWYYNDESTYGNTYGAMYNWHAVNTANLCPDGWHVPTDDEWKTLEMYLGMSSSEVDNTGYRGTNEGSKLAGYAALWSDGVLESDSEFDTSGFDAVPGGYRNGGSGEFLNLTGSCYYWSSSENDNSEAWYRHLYNHSTMISRNAIYEGLGLSVRCLKD